MTIERTHNWFAEAVNKAVINKRKQAVQVGVMIEEFTEILEAIDITSNTALLVETTQKLKELAQALKQDTTVELRMLDHKEFLDGLGDVIVTAVGSGYVFGMDVPNALGEINRSNYSKFVDGKAIFNEHGKIAKGPDFFKPNLEPFLGRDPAIDNTHN